MSRLIFIYALVDPDTDEVRYVGKATNLYKRFIAHINEKGSTRKCRWIAKLINSNKFPKIKILEIVRGVIDWKTAESYWIRFYRELGSDLCNHTSGGEGLHGASEETREKLRAIRKKDWEENRNVLLQRNRDPERCRKISAAHTGKPKTKEHVSKLKQNQPGRKLSEEHKAKISRALIGNQYAKGTKRTPDQIEVIRKASTGRKQPNRKPMPLESNIARSNTLKGRPKSAEWKEKIRLASFRRWSDQSARKEQSERLKQAYVAKRSENQSPKGDENEVR